MVLCLIQEPLHIKIKKTIIGGIGVQMFTHPLIILNIIFKYHTSITCSIKLVSETGCQVMVVTQHE